MIFDDTRDTNKRIGVARTSPKSGGAPPWTAAQPLPPKLHVASDPSFKFPWLTDQEVDDLCEGLTQNAAKIRYMRDVLKLPVAAKPNGRPLVPRQSCQHLLDEPPKHMEPPFEPAAHGNHPNEEALLQAMSRR